MSQISKLLPILLFSACLVFSTSCSSMKGAALTGQSGKREQWRAIHLFAPWHSEMSMFRRVISERLAPMGINTLVLEVNYKFAYQSHPELREPGLNLTLADVKELVGMCKANHIELIPLFNCLGHQSWSKTNFPLIIKYPELDETPGIPLDNEGIYCRSWCPLHPMTNKIVFELLDELVDAFEVRSFHVGMDEVFLIADDKCPRCRGKNPADLYARAVNDYHEFLVEKHHLTMLMWGDRLIDRKVCDYGNDYECSANGTAAAIDLIPKDIILCDWHYWNKGTFPSLVYFQKKGFRVMPSTWNDIEATRSFIAYAEENKTKNMIGYLFTTWVGAQDMSPALLEEGDASELPKDAILAAKALKEGLKLVGDRN